MILAAYEDKLTVGAAVGVAVGAGVQSGGVGKVLGPVVMCRTKFVLDTGDVWLGMVLVKSSGFFQLSPVQKMVTALLPGAYSGLPPWGSRLKVNDAGEGTVAATARLGGVRSLASRLFW
jgi:hypothetical protein